MFKGISNIFNGNRPIERKKVNHSTWPHHEFVKLHQEILSRPDMTPDEQSSALEVVRCWKRIAEGITENTAPIDYWGIMYGFDRDYANWTKRDKFEGCYDEQGNITEVGVRLRDEALGAAERVSRSYGDSCNIQG